MPRVNFEDNIVMERCELVYVYDNGEEEVLKVGFSPFNACDYLYEAYLWYAPSVCEHLYVHYLYQDRYIHCSQVLENIWIEFSEGRLL